MQEMRQGSINSPHEGCLPRTVSHQQYKACCHFIVLAKQAYALFSQQATESDDLYDEVDEAIYKAIVHGCLQQDDFIEDDDSGRYANNGMDAYDGEDSLFIEEEDSDHEQQSGFYFASLLF